MVVVFLAEGFEEVEALAPVDVMRRAGLAVKLAGVTGREVTGSHGICVQTDMDAQEVDATLPAFPSCQKDLQEGGALLSESYVVRDGQFLTARGMGVATQFGLALVEALVSPEKAADIRASIQWEA